MTLSNLKPFQQATVDHALARLRDPRGSKRFLVADEVGLGKTLVAQGIIQGLCQDRRISVFYICSSLGIAHQNRDSLLEILPEEERERARVEVDRLTLLPTTSPSRTARFNLYTLTPGTMPLRSQLGRVDERAVLSVLLRQCLEVRRNAHVLNELQGSVSDDTWQRERKRAEERLQKVPQALISAFKRHLAAQLGQKEAAWRSTLGGELEEALEASRGEATRKLRVALSLASLESLAPDLIIFDEFQRFFELIAGAGEDADEDADEDAQGLLQRLLQHGAETETHPAVLLLSATPYRLYGDGESGEPSAHYKELFQLLKFLLGPGGAKAHEALKAEFSEYGRLLRTGSLASTQVLEVRDRLQSALGRVMARTERSDLSSRGEAAMLRIVRVLPQAKDIGVFRHLRDSARSEHRFMVEPFWSSIPYPLQAMDPRGYVLRKDAEPKPMSKPLRESTIRWEWIRRYEKLEHPHPRLRALLQDMPPEVLALPWLPPTCRWWPLEGQFARAVEQAGEHGVSKALVFSRFRAVPRILSTMLSYEAERAAFGRDAQRGRKESPQKYDYSARSRSHSAGEESSRLCGQPQPRPAFVFSRSKSPESGLPLLLEFFPLPALAALGDPLPHLEVSGFQPSLGRMLERIKAVLAQKLGRSHDAGQRRPLWRWVRQLEQRGGSWEHLRKGWSQWMNRAPDAHRVAQHAAKFFLGQDSAPQRSPSDVELEELARIALLSPGCVLLRAVARVFGTPGCEAERVQRVTRASVECLRGYLDTPEFHLLMPGKNHRSAVHRAVWDGNLESVLDEYLATLAGLGAPTLKEGREARAMAALETALEIRASSVDLNALARDRKFKVRCHAALPLGLTPSEVVSEGGRIRSDFLRVAFNSPFRPFVLATTSIGQEGLDFHTYCSHLIHWDLPSNPVDLEQRDGRIRRFGGLAVRRAMADKPLPLKHGQSPWRQLGLELLKTEDAGGLTPWWSHPSASVQRTVYMPCFSEMEQALERRLFALSLYRMALGQPDQEQLVRALQRRLDDAGEQREAVLAWLRQARLSLSPYFNGLHKSRDRTGADRANLR